MKRSPIQKLVKEYILEVLSFQPLWGTSLGIPGYDNLLGDFSEERIREHSGNLKRIRARFPSLPKNPTHSIDYIEGSLLKNDLEMRILEWDDWQRYRKDPSFYVGELIYGLWYSVLRISSPAERAEALIQRMLQAPQLLDAARRNLKNPPRLWVEITLHEAQGYLSFLQEIYQELKRIAPRRLPEIQKALQVAKQTGEQFHQFLKGLLSKTKKGDMP